MIKKTFPKRHKLESNIIPRTFHEFPFFKRQYPATISSQVISAIICNHGNTLRNIFISSSWIEVQSSIIQILFSPRNRLFVWRRRLSITPTIFAREFSLWCGRGTEPSAIARGRGETKIIDLIEGADKRPFTSLWITLRVSTCIYI